MAHLEATATRARRADRRASWVVLPVAIACWVLPAPAGAQQRLYPADQIKAAFLYYFGTYVEWDAAPEAEGAPLTIAVLGADGVAAELAEYVPGRTIQGRPARVRRLRSMREFRGAEILFIGAAENDRLDEHLEAVTGRPVLTVTDTPDGLAPGAIVNFRLVDRQIRFEISLRAAEAAGLTLSSRLLSAALRVKTAQRSAPRRACAAAAASGGSRSHSKGPGLAERGPPASHVPAPGIF